MIIDSVICIALKHERDKWHTQAKSLIPKILEVNKIYLTDNILTETYNFLLRKVSYDAAKETLEHFILEEKYEIIYNNNVSVNATLTILRELPSLSYTDANIIWHCRTRQIDKVMSFDAGFDQIDGVTRIHQ